MFRRVLFIGSKESGFNVLKILYKLSPDTLVGCVTVDDITDTRSKRNEIDNYCNGNSIPIDILTGRCDLTASIEKYKPDLCIVMGWYYIISETVLNSVNGGFVGIHNSLLPAHRGFAPVVWAMIAGEKETGFSVFSFDKGMDTGDIWYQEKIEIGENDYISSVLNKIDNRIEAFFENNYLRVLSGEIKPSPQTNESISYGARRLPEDGRIDWNKSAKEIYNFIRAQSHPYPGAFSEYNGNTLRIFQSRCFNYPIQGTPGQIGLIEKDAVVVVCGDNTGLVLDKIEVNGREIKTTEYIKGIAHYFS